MHLPGSGSDPVVSSSTPALNATRSNISAANSSFSCCPVSSLAGTSYARPTKDLESEERDAIFRRQSREANVVSRDESESRSVPQTPRPKDRKEVKAMSIFAKKDNGQVNVPEIEVRGDEVRVPETDDGQAQDREQPPQDRTYKLPKTKWFGNSGF